MCAEPTASRSVSIRGPLLVNHCANHSVPFDAFSNIDVGVDVFHVRTSGGL